MAGNKHSGRKPKSDEIALIEKLTPLEDKAFEELEKGIERGEFQFVRLYFQYMYGKPKQITEISINQEEPIFNIDLECLQEPHR
jgi:hypothetical protein